MPSEYRISPYFPGLKLPHAKNFEANRLASYSSWSHDQPVFASSLAKAGLYHTGNKDEVQCPFCSFRYSEWKSGQVPWDVHQQLSPRCYLFTEIIDTASVHPNICLPEHKSNNISAVLLEYFDKTEVPTSGVQDTGLEEENKDETVNPPIQFPGVNRRLVRQLRPRIRANDIPDLPRAADGSLPYTAIHKEVAEDELYSQFSSERKRQQTFYNFPLGVGRLVKQLISHGFFYTGNKHVCSDYF